jgi:hypothetical protein
MKEFIHGYRPSSCPKCYVILINYYMPNNDYKKNNRYFMFKSLYSLLFNVLILPLWKKLLPSIGNKCQCLYKITGTYFLSEGVFDIILSIVYTHMYMYICMCLKYDDETMLDEIMRIMHG